MAGHCAGAHMILAGHPVLSSCNAHRPPTPGQGGRCAIDGIQCHRRCTSPAPASMPCSLARTTWPKPRRPLTICGSTALMAARAVCVPARLPPAGSTSSAHVKSTASRSLPALAPHDRPMTAAAGPRSRLLGLRLCCYRCVTGRGRSGATVGMKAGHRSLAPASVAPSTLRLKV